MPCARSRESKISSRVLGLALLLIGASHAVAHGQEEETVFEFGVPTPDEVHLDAYKDFQEFVAQEDWSRAFRSIEEPLENPPSGLLPSSTGVHLSYADRLWHDLANLPRDGRRAFQVYYDAKAKRLFDRAQAEEDRGNRLAGLRSIHSRYFATQWGDQVADALARACLEDGDPHGAAIYWGQILEHHRRTDLDELLLGAERVLALAAAGHSDIARSEVRRLVLRHREETVETTAGTFTIEELAARLPEADAPADVTARPSRLDVVERPEPLWRLSHEAWEGRAQGGWQPSRQVSSPVLPAAEAGQGELLINQGGATKRLSAEDGDAHWSAGEVSDTVTPTAMAGRLYVERIGDLVLATTDLAESSGLQVHLGCYDYGTGLELWSTAKDKDYRELGLAGRPAVKDGQVFLTMQPVGTYNLMLVAADLKSGELLWKVPLGTPVSAAASNPWMWMGSGLNLPIQPQVLIAGEEVLVVTDSCAVLAVNKQGGEILWAYTQPVERRFDDGVSPGSAILAKGVLYLRSQGNRGLFALDVKTRQELWVARVDPAERIVASDEECLYLLGDNLRCLELSTGARRWSRSLTALRGTKHIVQTEGFLYVLTRRGLYEIDKETGDNGVGPRRGALTRLRGGDLFLVGDTLICVCPDEIVAIAVRS